MKHSKKKRYALSLVFVIICIVFSCRVIHEIETSLLDDQSVSDWDGSSVNWTYDGTWVQQELPKNVRTLNIKTTEPVDIFMAKMNIGKTILPAISTRYIVSKGILSAEKQLSADFPNELTSSNKILSELESLENVSGISASGFIRKDYVPARDFVPPSLEDLTRGTAGRFATDSSSVQSQQSIVKEWKIGDTKELWVDIPKGQDSVPSKDIFNGTHLQTYTKRTATLKAIGTHCYVWVLNDYFTLNDSVDSNGYDSLINTVVEKFEQMYEPIRNVFGEESNKMIDSQIVDISTVSDTGTKVNIVIYDIEGDYEDTFVSGTIGYFWLKDYYTQNIANRTSVFTKEILQLTNEGKYFYIDAGFLLNDIEMTISTLAHEFQHMINYGQKSIASMERGDKIIVRSKTWSNEMMSMVCEDMVQNLLKIRDVSSPLLRFFSFCTNYYRSGLIEWLAGNNTFYSYAMSYVFGTYLARNYGGTKLFNEISTNPYADQESITQALKAIGSKETFDTVFEKYPQALFINNPPSGVDVPSFNKTVAGIGGDMNPIDIFNLKFWDDGIEYYVPIKLKYLSANAATRVDLRPHGFTLHDVGDISSAGEIELKFSSPVNEDEKIYILIQPKS